MAMEALWSSCECSAPGQDRQREGIDDEAEQHEVVAEAAHFLGAEPVDVGERPHRLALLLAQQQQADQGQSGDEQRDAASRRRRSAKPSPLVKVPTLIGRK